MVVTTRILAPGELGTICPICQSPIAADEACLSCPDCDQIHHEECWQEIGGCGTYGCKQAPAVVKPEAVTPGTAWGDQKQCPVCGETIKSVAILCRYCKTKFATADPLTRKDLYRQATRANEQWGLQTTTIVLFIFTLLGFTAPLAGLVSSAYLLPKQDQLWKCGPLYLILAWATLVLSGLFTVMILVFAIFEWVQI